jgi:hypothetical protein
MRKECVCKDRTFAPPNANHTAKTPQTQLVVQYFSAEGFFAARELTSCD